MSAQSVAIIVAIVTGVPGILAAVYAYRVKHENPMENGQDWVVNHYRTIAQDALDENERLKAENAVLRGVPPGDA